MRLFKTWGKKFSIYVKKVSSNGFKFYTGTEDADDTCELRVCTNWSKRIPDPETFLGENLCYDLHSKKWRVLHYNRTKRNTSSAFKSV